MTHDEMIEVIAAHRDGKTIQYRYTTGGAWIDCSIAAATFDFTDMEYRIKPEPLTLNECWSCAWRSSLVIEHVLIEFIKLAKENGHV